MKRKYYWDRAKRDWVERIPRHDRPMGAMLIRDDMNAAVHPVTGEVLESKSQFRRRTREAGYIEVGNDVKVEPRALPDVPGRAQELKRVWEELSNR
jgi:hypothetical protein